MDWIEARSILGFFIAFIVFIFAILVWLFFVMAVTTGQRPPPRNVVVAMERYFQRNNEQIHTVVDYFVELGDRYNTNHISTSTMHTMRDGTIFVASEHGHIAIECEVALDAINHLFTSGFNVIAFTNNYIQFQRWSTLNMGWGVLYLFAGDEPYTHPTTNLTLLSSLSEDGWYFYSSE